MMLSAKNLLQTMTSQSVIDGMQDDELQLPAVTSMSATIAMPSTKRKIAQENDLELRKTNMEQWQ